MSPPLYFLPTTIVKIHFLNNESNTVWEHIEKAGRCTSNGQAFSDFLTMTVCALSGGQMEDQYLQAVKRYSEGEKGKRGCDHLANAFAALIQAMETTRVDILGDIFQGAITFGEHGQFFTPEPICSLLAQMTAGSPQSVYDPCCGSGRTLLAHANLGRCAEFFGQDIDRRCVQMTAINLSLRNLYGWVILGNSLANEAQLIYRTGFNGKGFIAEVDSLPVHASEKMEDAVRPMQLSLF